jgi:motility quorum-sensing regulator/GCU-specific mRNA interferase toxin
MEKRTPHCSLSVVRSLIAEGKAHATFTASTDARELGFDLAGMIAVVHALTPADFYKSMTTYNDHRIWHDVYRPATQFGRIYLKLTVIDDVLIVSFKEL